MVKSIIQRQSAFEREKKNEKRKEKDNEQEGKVDGEKFLRRIRSLRREMSIPTDRRVNRPQRGREVL